MRGGANERTWAERARRARLARVHTHTRAHMLAHTHKHTVPARPAGEAALSAAVLNCTAAQSGALAAALMRAYVAADHVVGLDVDKDAFDKFNMRSQIGGCCAGRCCKGGCKLNMGSQIGGCRAGRWFCQRLVASVGAALGAAASRSVWLGVGKAALGKSLRKLSCK